VRVVEVDLPDPTQTDQDAGQFTAEHRTQFGVPHGQVAVAVRAGGVDLGVVGAVGGAQHVLLLTHPHRGEHVGGELPPVSGPFEQFAFGQHRGADAVTSAALPQFRREPLELAPHHGAVRQPQRQAGSDDR